MPTLAGWTLYQEFTVNTGALTETRSADNICFIRLDDRDAAFWAGIKADGGDIAILGADGVTRLPGFLLYFDYAGQKGLFQFKGGTDDTFYLCYGNAAASQPGIADPFGANALFDSYSHVYNFSSVDTVNYAQNGTKPLVWGTGTPALNAYDADLGAPTMDARAYEAHVTNTDAAPLITPLGTNNAHIHAIGRSGTGSNNESWIAGIVRNQVGGNFGAGDFRHWAAAHTRASTNSVARWITGGLSDTFFWEVNDNSNVISPQVNTAYVYHGDTDCGAGLMRVQSNERENTQTPRTEVATGNVGDELLYVGWLDFQGSNGNQEDHPLLQVRMSNTGYTYGSGNHESEHMSLLDAATYWTVAPEAALGAGGPAPGKRIVSMV